jgi:hypothetical protein
LGPPVEKAWDPPVPPPAPVLKTQKSDTSCPRNFFIAAAARAPLCKARSDTGRDVVEGADADVVFAGRPPRRGRACFGRAGRFAATSAMNRRHPDKEKSSPLATFSWFN